MIRKLTDDELLKYWLDSEITIIHAMLAFIATLIVHSRIGDTILWIYIIYSVLYAAARISVVVNQKRDYLRLPKDDPDIVPRPGEL